MSTQQPTTLDVHGKISRELRRQAESFALMAYIARAENDDPSVIEGLDIVAAHLAKVVADRANPTDEIRATARRGRVLLASIWKDPADLERSIVQQVATKHGVEQASMNRPVTRDAGFWDDEDPRAWQDGEPGADPGMHVCVHGDAENDRVNAKLIEAGCTGWWDAEKQQVDHDADCAHHGFFAASTEG